MNGQRLAGAVECRTSRTSDRRIHPFARGRVNIDRASIYWAYRLHTQQNGSADNWCSRGRSSTDKWRGASRRLMHCSCIVCWTKLLTHPTRLTTPNSTPTSAESWNSPLRRSGWHVLNGSRSFTCYPHVFSRMEWAIPPLHPAVEHHRTLADTHFPSHRG